MPNNDKKRAPGPPLGSKNNPRGGPPETLFKKGAKPGPGRPKGILTKEMVRRRMSRMTALSRSEVQKIIDDPESPALEIMIARIVLKTIGESAANEVNFLFERTIGKVKDEIKLEAESLAEVEKKRSFARAILTDPQSLAAASIIASRVAQQKLDELKEIPAPEEERYEPQDDEDVIDVELTDES